MKKPTTKKIGNVLGIDLLSVAKYCKGCDTEKTGDKFHIQKQRKAKGRLVGYLSSLCKDCHASEIRKSRKSEYDKERWSGYRFKQFLQDRYGLLPDQYAEILRNQDGKCVICGMSGSGEKDKRRLHVDHDHETGEIRGLLCNNCNNGLGRFKDNPFLLRKAANYLEKINAQQETDYQV
jgi:hypothetical protein